MKNPLHYQITEYDCGPTSLLNGISFLFEREDIPPEIVRNIMLYSLDGYGPDGISGKSGTSHTAMLFLSHWLDGFGKTGRLSVSSIYLSGQGVNLNSGGRLRDALRRGGAAVVRLDLDGWHYVLMTDVNEDSVFLFDPYRITKNPFPIKGVHMDNDHPCKYNRVVPIKLIDQEEIVPYAFGAKEEREAVLLFNKKTVLTQENTVEYII